MNRRIKIKKLKQENELLKQLVNPAFAIPKDSGCYQQIRTLCTDRVFRKEEIEFLGDERIADILARSLAEGIKQYMNIEKCYDSCMPGCEKYTALLDIVV